MAGCHPVLRDGLVHPLLNEYNALDTLDVKPYTLYGQAEEGERHLTVSLSNGPTCVHPGSGLGIRVQIKRSGC